MQLIVIVQTLSYVRLFTAPWTAAYQATLSSTVSQSSLKFRSFESVMLSNHLILCHPLLLLLSVFPSIRVFSSEWAFCIRGPKYWSSSFSISPSNEYSGLISFRIDWFDLLTVQRTFKSPAPQFKKNQLFSAHPSLQYNSYICTWLPGKPQLWLYRPLLAMWCLRFLMCCLGLSFLFFKRASVVCTFVCF